MFSGGIKGTSGMKLVNLSNYLIRPLILFDYFCFHHKGLFINSKIWIFHKEFPYRISGGIVRLYLANPS